MPGHVYGDAVIVTYMYSHCESSPGSSDECRSAPDGRRPSQPTWALSPPVYAAIHSFINTHKAAENKKHNRSTITILLLLSPKADTHFTVPRRVEG